MKATKRIRTALVALSAMVGGYCVAYSTKGISYNGKHTVERSIEVRPSLELFFGVPRSKIYRKIKEHCGDITNSPRKTVTSLSGVRRFFSTTESVRKQEWWRNTMWFCEVKRELSKGMEASPYFCDRCKYIKSHPKALFSFTEYYEGITTPKSLNCEKCRSEMDITALRFARVRINQIETTYQNQTETNRTAKVQSLRTEILKVCTPQEFNSKAYYLDEYERNRIMEQVENIKVEKCK